MPVTIDATVGGASSNSYSTLSEADLYHNDRLNNAAWHDATLDNKSRALIMATRLLDIWFDWEGSMVQSTQALLWPRLDALDRAGVEFTSDVIPQFLKDATAELALWLLVEDRTADPDTKGFQSLSVGNLQMVIDKHDRRSVIPESVSAMVRWYGTLRQANSTTRRLLRV